MGYATLANVRAISSLTTTEISDADLQVLIDFAAVELNSAIGVRIRWEDFSANPLNTLNGTATEFQTRRFPLGDLNNSFTATVADLIIYNRTSSNAPFKKVSNPLASIDAEQGLFTFTTAPEVTKEWRVEYVWVPIILTDTLIARANAELAAYMAHLRSNLLDVRQYRLGKLEVKKELRQPLSVAQMNHFDRYMTIVNQIRSKQPMMMRRITYDNMQAMADEIIEVIRDRPPTTLHRGEVP